MPCGDQGIRGSRGRYRASRPAPWLRYLECSSSSARCRRGVGPADGHGLEADGRDDAVLQMLLPVLRRSGSPATSQTPSSSGNMRATARAGSSHAGGPRRRVAAARCRPTCVSGYDIFGITSRKAEKRTFRRRVPWRRGLTPASAGRDAPSHAGTSAIAPCTARVERRVRADPAAKPAGRRRHRSARGGARSPRRRSAAARSARPAIEDRRGPRRSAGSSRGSASARSSRRSGGRPPRRARASSIASSSAIFAGPSAEEKKGRTRQSIGIGRGAS